MNFFPWVPLGYPSPAALAIGAGFIVWLPNPGQDPTGPDRDTRHPGPDRPVPDYWPLVLRCAAGVLTL